jgi:hypothetical protein
VIAFVSHNRADKDTARLLAEAFDLLDVGVWFDEWKIRPGESITGGIEAGLSAADVFVLVWSAAAQESKWVGTEIRAYLRRRIDDETLRIVPVMVDETPLPTLLADYRGFQLGSADDLNQIAADIAGIENPIDLSRRLQARLNEIQARLTEIGYAETRGAPFPYLVCPECTSANLHRHEVMDYVLDDTWFVITCDDCGWEDATQ